MVFKRAPGCGCCGGCEICGSGSTPKSLELEIPEPAAWTGYTPPPAHPCDCTSYAGTYTLDYVETITGIPDSCVWETGEFSDPIGDCSGNLTPADTLNIKVTLSIEFQDPLWVTESSIEFVFTNKGNTDFTQSQFGEWSSGSCSTDLTYAVTSEEVIWSESVVDDYGCAFFNGDDLIITPIF